MTMEELISSLRSHVIELEQDKSQKKVKYVALKSKGRPEKAKALQDEKEESDESSNEENELSLLSRRVNQLYN